MRIASPVLIALSLALAAPALAASPLDAPDVPGADRYDRCLNLVRTKPQIAFDAALAWRDEGGGAPAEHCIAVSLVGLGHYGEGAVRLDKLAHDRTAGDAGNRAALLDQAGNAWLLAGQPEDALASFSAALKLTPNDPDLLADRARAKAMKKDWAGADADLSAALTISPKRPELLVLRASARRAMGQSHQALADLEAALKLRPDYDEALVERGALRFDAGDKAGARADWRKVIAQFPDSPAADAAREHIEQLEVGAPVGHD
jgi:tetratricopeptide (TPR) repeat protein